MAKVLLTGSTGFIGKNVLEKLRLTGHEVIELNRASGDIADTETWSDLLPADVVVHLAALTFVPDSWVDPHSFMKTNLQGAVCALEYCRKHQSKLIFLSTYMYGNPESLPIPEDARLHAFNPYALSKKMAEDACLFYAENFKVPTVILRPFNVYGPGQKTDFLIPSIIKQALAGEPIKVKVLEPKRDYIYIDDLAQSIILAIAFKQSFGVFNVGTGKSYSVAELIAVIQQSMDTRLPVQASGEKRPEEVMDTRADISKAANMLGWQPRWSLEQGIAEIIAIEKKKDKRG